MVNFRRIADQARSRSTSAAARRPQGGRREAGDAVKGKGSLKDKAGRGRRGQGAGQERSECRARIPAIRRVYGGGAVGSSAHARRRR